jgi:hypothetical protein
MKPVVLALVLSRPFCMRLGTPSCAAAPIVSGRSPSCDHRHVLLAFAYRHGELGQVYPIVRAGVPLMVTLGGFVFAWRCGRS